MKVLAIGHPDAVLGFSLAGVDCRVATTAREVNQALDDVLSAPDVGIVLVTQDVADLIEDRMSQLKLRSMIPLVVDIPGPDGVRAGHPSLSEIIQRTIGVKI